MSVHDQPTTTGLLWPQIPHGGRNDIGYAVQRVCRQYEAEKVEQLGPKYTLDDLDVRVVFNDAFRLGYLLAQGAYSPDALGESR